MGVRVIGLALAKIRFVVIFVKCERTHQCCEGSAARIAWQAKGAARSTYGAGCCDPTNNQ
jgi:hypothetical protein